MLISQSEAGTRLEHWNKVPGNTNRHLEPDDVIIDYMSEKARYWFYTVNNPTKSLSEYEQLLQSKSIKYAMQVEKGTSGTRHLQALLRFKSAVRFNTAKIIFPGERPHCEIARDPRKSIEYCTKTESREEGPVGVPIERVISFKATKLFWDFWIFRNSLLLIRTREPHTTFPTCTHFLHNFLKTFGFKNLINR